MMSWQEAVMFLRKWQMGTGGELREALGVVLEGLEARIPGAETVRARGVVYTPPDHSLTVARIEAALRVVEALQATRSNALFVAASSFLSEQFGGSVVVKAPEEPDRPEVL